MALAPQLLRTNKLVRIEGRTFMLKINNFSVILNQATYLGCAPNAKSDHICYPRFESERVHRPSRNLLESKKLEVAAIVGTALGELCEILSFSNNLSTLEVSFLDLGTNQLTTGNEHKVLRCLREVKETKHIQICGMPKVAEEYLEKVMK